MIQSVVLTLFDNRKARVQVKSYDFKSQESNSKREDNMDYLSTLKILGPYILLNYRVSANWHFFGYF